MVNKKENIGLKIAVAVMTIAVLGAIVFSIYADDYFYNKVKDSNDIEELESYIKKNASSDHVKDARIRIELLDYQKALSSDDFEVLMAFDAKYSKSSNNDAQHLERVRSLIASHEDEFVAKYIDAIVPDTADFNKYEKIFSNGKRKDYVAQKRQAIFEEIDYKALGSYPTANQCREFLSRYPKSSHLAEVKQTLSRLEEVEAYTEAKRLGSASAYAAYLKKYPNGAHASEIKELQAYEKYKNNSLSNGSQPWASHYGHNGYCSSWGCSEIKVTAPSSSDLIAIVKYNNQDGRVARHAYIRKGCSVTFEVSNGRYQVFFYYGKGWYPDKKMAKGVRGGFLEDELYSKADPEYLDNQRLEYVLQLTRNGNYSTTPSNSSDAL